MSRSITPHLAFYISAPHLCSYLEGREAVSLVADPDAHIDTHQYSELARYGFRRSGSLVYRPRCPDCNACLPVRIPVARFRASRSQLRNLRANHDLRVIQRPPTFDAEHFALYQRYMASRHAGGGMDEADPDQYISFLVSPYVETAFYELRAGARLLAVAVVDHLDDALSAVYTFFEPESRRGLGVYGVLWQIEHARKLGLRYVYLGYWIKACQKMSYKGAYRPLQIYRDGEWVEETDSK